MTKQEWEKFIKSGRVKAILEVEALAKKTGKYSEPQMWTYIYNSKKELGLL